MACHILAVYDELYQLQWGLKNKSDLRNEIPKLQHMAWHRGMIQSPKLNYTVFLKKFSICCHNTTGIQTRSFLMSSCLSPNFTRVVTNSLDSLHPASEIPFVLVMFHKFS